MFNALRLKTFYPFLYGHTSMIVIGALLFSAKEITCSCEHGRAMGTAAASRVYSAPRGGTVTVRNLMQSYAPLKNQRVEAEAALNALSAIDYGKWGLFSTTEKGWRPMRIFKLLPYLRNL
jgi:hypothetical protein